MVGTAYYRLLYMVRLTILIYFFTWDNVDSQPRYWKTFGVNLDILYAEEFLAYLRPHLGNFQRA
jgi:hypothetical protein